MAALGTAANPNVWVQPVGGKTVKWRFAKVSDGMDLDANYGRSDRAHLRKYAQFAMRIVSFEGKVEPFQVNDFRDWEEYDLEQFAEEVATKEMARAAALSQQKAGSPIPNLERAIEAAQVAANNLATELRNVLMAAKATEQQLGPLSHAPSSQP